MQTLNNLNPKYVEILDSILSFVSNSYKHSFKKHDLEDIVSEARIACLKYMPELESELHARNWANLYSRRYFINAMRNFCVYNKKHHALLVNEEDKIVEEYSGDEFIREENYNERYIKVKDNFIKLNQFERNLIYNYNIPKNELSKKLGISEFKIRKIMRKFQKSCQQ